MRSKQADELRAQARAKAKGKAKPPPASEDVDFQDPGDSVALRKDEPAETQGGDSIDSPHQEPPPVAVEPVDEDDDFVIVPPFCAE